MQCPLGDSELISHTTQGEQGLTVSYSTCPICRGYWMDYFSANYILHVAEQSSDQKTISNQKYSCPVCTTPLTLSKGDNIPDDVSVFECPDHHGYFFPIGQLAAFKKAQKAKIEYHKLWHIAMPNVGSILLGGLVLLILSGGFAATFVRLQQKQTTESQAAQILTNHALYISSNHTSVIVTATTAFDTIFTIHIPALGNFTAPMESQDHRTHLLKIDGMTTGTYQYYFTITDTSGHKITSDMYTFTITP